MRPGAFYWAAFCPQTEMPLSRGAVAIIILPVNVAARGRRNWTRAKGRKFRRGFSSAGAEGDRPKMYVPTKLFFTKGVGTHREKLSSFEMALRDARIACYNLVRVSSIFPPNCKEISIDEGLKQLQPGQIVHVVMSENATAEPNRLVAASVGVAIPRSQPVRLSIGASRVRSDGQSRRRLCGRPGRRDARHRIGGRV